MRARLVLALGSVLVLVMGASCADSGADATATTEPATTASSTNTTVTTQDLEGPSTPPPLNASTTEIGRDGSTIVERVEFDAADGERVPALLSLPRSVDSTHACVLVSHGLGGRKEEVATAGPLFAGVSMGAMAIDGRLHGERAPDDLAALAGSGDGPEIFATMIEEWVDDLTRAIDYLQTRAECDPDRIGFLGFSLGAMIGAILGGTDDRLRAPLLVSGGGDWELIIETSDHPVIVALSELAGGASAAAAALEDVDPIDYAPMISPEPVLFLHGDADPTVVPASAQALFDAAEEPKEIQWWSGGHAPEGSEAARVFTLMAGWFQRQLA